MKNFNIFGQNRVNRYLQKRDFVVFRHLDVFDVLNVQREHEAGDRQQNGLCVDVAVDLKERLQRRHFILCRISDAERRFGVLRLLCFGFMSEN